jgi:nucleoside-diphosphate-sugar epimerase
LNLVEVLLEEGWEVTALHRPTSKLDLLAPTGARLVVGDLRAPESLASAVPQGVDAVFHTAADVRLSSRDIELQYAVNVRGTQDLVEVALERDAGCFVHVSSIMAYGMQATVDESSELLGRGSWIAYSRFKVLGEDAVRAGVERGLAASILTPVHIVGRYDLNGWGSVLATVTRGELPGAPSGSGDFCNVREVARAMRAAAERRDQGESYLLGGPHASLKELCDIAAELAGRRPPRVMPGWLMRAIARVSLWGSRVTGREPELTPEVAAMMNHHYAVDDSKAREILGYRHVPLRTSVEEWFAWRDSLGLP